PSVYRTSTVQNDPNPTIEHHILASGGIKYQVDTMSTGTIKQGESTITGVDANIVKKLAKGMVTNNVDLAPHDSYIFLPGTTIVKAEGTSIELSKPAQLNWPGGSFTFIGSQFDGSGTRDGATLTLKKDVQVDRTLLTSLKEGMLVTSDGGDIPEGTKIDKVDVG